MGSVPFAWWSKGSRWVIGALAIAFLTLAVKGALLTVGVDTRFQVLFAGVSLAAVAMGPAAGVLTTLATVIGDGVLFLQPAGQLSIDDLDEAVLAGLFVLNGLLVSTLSYLLIRRRQGAEERAAALQDSEARFRSVFESHPNALLVVDETGRVAHANAEAASLFGYDVEALIGLLVDRLVPGERREVHGRHRATYARAPVARKMGRDLELQGRRRDGSQFPVDVALRSYVEGGRRYTIAAVVDLTAQGQADQIRRRFIDVLSHELRTPVTTIFGAAQVLRGRGRDLDPAIVDELVDGIIEQSDRLHRIVENLLVVARVERGVDLTGGEPVLIQRLLPRLIERAQGHWPDLRVHLHAPSDIPMVSADEASLSLLLENLISNAAKYGGAAGEVDVETRSVDGSVEVSVADRGPGVADADIPRVFELFYRAPRTEKVAPGSGIGLFVSRALAEGMGGWLRVAQRSGGGSVFTLTLPVYVAEPDEPAHSDGLVKRAGSAVRAGRE